MTSSICRERVAGDFEVLSGAAAQVDEAVVEAAEVEEQVEARTLDARELAQLGEAR